MSCSGRCCAVFPLGGLTYAELEVRYHHLSDGATIFDMVRPLTRDEAAVRLLDLGLTGTVGDEPLFRCVRWDETTRLCTRYDERPELCRDYPYASECDHGCGHQEPTLTRWRWATWRASGGRPNVTWAWDGRDWQPSMAPLTLPG